MNISKVTYGSILTSGMVKFKLLQLNIILSPTYWKGTPSLVQFLLNNFCPVAQIASIHTPLDSPWKTESPDIYFYGWIFIRWWDMALNVEFWILIIHGEASLWMATILVLTDFLRAHWLVQIFQTSTSNISSII